MIEKIKEKVRKLLARAAEGSGSSEAEQDMAMRAAMLLMAEHGIRQEDIGDSEVNKSKFGARNHDRFLPYKIYAATAAGILYGCTFVMYNKGIKGIAFVGRPDNIEATEETLEWIVAQIDVAHKAVVPNDLKGNDRSAWVNKFRVNCALRVITRAEKLISDVEQGKGNGTALVPVDYFRKLQGENQLTLRTIAARPQKVGGIGKHTDASLAGRIAGDSIKLRKEVR